MPADLDPDLATLAPDDATRLAALDHYDIMGTLPEQGFNDIVLLASRICRTPIALVSFVASDRQWFKARVGLDDCETPLSQSVCAHAIRQRGPLVIPDLTVDPRTRQNTLVTDGPQIRFYAGARLETPDGIALGTLCVIDTRPRPEGLSDEQVSSLEALARQVMTQLELRAAKGKQDAQLAAAQDALRQSLKMEAIGQLTGGIAHDFNNLLTGIVGSVDIVRLRLAAGSTKDVPRFLDVASSAARRAAALTHRLLAFARRQPVETRPNDVNRIVMGLEDILRRTLGKEVGLRIRLAGDLWPGLTDANQLENAILNLAINARDAMPDGGLLTIETENTRLDADDARVNEAVSAGDYVLISVSDTGTGMPPEVIAKAFEPFFTTKPMGAGTGLGLSMVHEFAKQSLGHLRIFSEVGRGTVVKLYLARATSDAADLPAVTVAEAPRGQGETVLVVEDDATVRLLLTSVLEELGYQYFEAPDAATATALLRSPRRLDLLITDVGLPVTNGRQLAEIAREARPGLKVLFVTGNGEGTIFGNGPIPSGMDVLTKPFALDVLGTKIRAVIER